MPFPPPLHLPCNSDKFTIETRGSVAISEAAVVVFIIHSHKDYLKSEVTLIFLAPRKEGITVSPELRKN